MKLFKFNLKLRQRGVVTLTISTGVLLASTLMTMYASKSAQVEHKIYNNDYTAKQAFEAAEAGLEYGLKYLETNKASILVDADNDGAIDSTNANVSNTQTNNSTYAVTFSNPIQSDTSLIKISVSGISKDGKNTKKITQLVKYYPILDNLKMPKVPFTSKGPVDLQGDPAITNMESPVAVWSGEGVVTNGAADIVNSTGNNDPSGLVENDINLKNISEDDLFTNYFGNNKNKVRQNASNFYTFTNDEDAIDGVENTFLWFNGDLSLTGNTTIGTITKPVLLIVDGNLDMKGNTTINGFVFVTGDFSTGNGTSEINGALVVRGESIFKGTSDITFDSAILSRIGIEQGLFVKVPGSWKDS